MSDEEKLSMLEDARDSLVNVVDELNSNQQEFADYINCLSDTIAEMTEEIEQLEEEQNKIWKREMQQAHRDFESMKF